MQLLAIAWSDRSLVCVAFKPNGQLHYKKTATSSEATGSGKPVHLDWIDSSRQLLIADDTGCIDMWQIKYSSDLEVDWELELVCFSCLSP